MTEVGFQISDSSTFNVAIVWAGSPSTGTFSCSAMGPPSAGAALAYDVYWLSWGGGSCTVTLTEFGRQSGARIAGTFSGVVRAGGSRTPAVRTITQGTFALTWP
jgi:hypothetical protein